MIALAATATLSAQITGSMHDFSQTTGGDRCVVCHPSSGAPQGKQKPLWAPSATAAKLGGRPAPGAVTDFSGVTSSLCLGCHDGSLAGTAVFCTWGEELGGSRAPTMIDPRRNHPFAIPYTAVLAAKKRTLHDPATRVVPGLGGKTIQRAMLFNNQLECFTCHDVHRQRGQSAANKNLLVLATQDSQLCLTCHIK